MKLRHEQPEESASYVTVHYDNKIRNLEVNENGEVEVENKLQAEQLQETHGKFKPVDGSTDDLPDYVLADKNVGEVEQYVRDINDVERLKELRKKEDRKTAVQHIDDRIEEVEENQPTDVDYEEVEDENQDNAGSEEEPAEENQDEEQDNEEDDSEDGEETEE